jgi:hypothetical protein
MPFGFCFFFPPRSPRAKGAPALVRTLHTLAVALLVLSASGIARADKVTVLPFQVDRGARAASREVLEAARDATRRAAVARGHTLPSASEMRTAEMAVRDGGTEQSATLRAAGRASSADWVVIGFVAPGEEAYRLELFASQVDSGRLESVAREVLPTHARGQIGQMLDLLLRPEGVGSGEMAWPEVPPDAPSEPEPEPEPPATDPPIHPEPPCRPVAPDKARIRYGTRPFAVGIGADVMQAVVRPAEAQGDATVGLGSIHVAYALEAVPGLDLHGDVGAVVFGPSAVRFEAGARYLLAPFRGVRLHVGPELGIGALVTTGADQRARFLAHGAAVISVGLGDRVSLELAPAVDAAPAAGGGTLLLVGGGARALVRF